MSSADPFFCDPRHSRRASLRLGAALLSFAGLAAIGLESIRPAYGHSAAFKLVTLIVRKDGISRAESQHHWLENRAAMVRNAGIRGLIVSELVDPSGTKNFTGNADAIVSAWYDDRQSAIVAMNSPEGLPLIAGIADESNSKSFVTREHVFIPPARLDGAIKRISFVMRNPGLTHAEFMRHWLEAHGPGARGIPGLKGFILTELDSGPAQIGGASLANQIDGISESWWEGGDPEQGGMVSSPAHAKWSADGNSIIDRERSAAFVAKEHVLIPPEL